MPDGAPDAVGALRTGGTLAYSDGARSPDAAQEKAMSHQPPKESKKKPQHTPKEKKSIKQQKKQATGVAPFIKH